jgi:hypothetical protein
MSDLHPRWHTSYEEEYGSVDVDCDGQFKAKYLVKFTFAQWIAG